ncbi:MAG: hypothetical protein ACI9NC_006089 [Verrucomicrobiales bacterium]|jgi:hypothetical protein
MCARPVLDELLTPADSTTIPVIMAKVTIYHQPH